jgi:3',5'-cyclic AMP phosphodiesterase CpdA
MGIMLINAPWFVGAALVLLLAGWFALDGLRYVGRAVRCVLATRPASTLALAGLGNLTVAGLLAVRGRGAVWAIAIAGALRILGTAWNITQAAAFSSSDSDRTVLDDLGVPDRPEIADLARRMAAEEAARAPIDRGWIAAFVVTLFAIHLGRTGLDRSFLGVMTPSLAVAGDLVVALLAAFVFMVPVWLAWRKLTRGLERRLWLWCLDPPRSGRARGRRPARAFLTRRLRSSIRLRQARYSLPTAVSRGLQIGLPVAAIIAATVPVWGMSWYFDTENWAAGVWNSWAEERTDTWRAAMVEAESELPGPKERTFSLMPAGVAGGADFSFVVIGDTGEGDASQHVLRDRYLDVVRKDEVRFVILSSDVVYPIGAMRDYEAKFWLPFKGTEKPVYAIPGNHDWYDALEAFNATFLEPDAARAAMRARIEADNGLTSTTDARIEELIAEASRLQREYQVPTQFQRAPFFQIQTDRFALIAVDTGVARTVDPRQMAWLRGALDQARGKLTMAVLGHPFYAGGHDTAGDNQDFAALRQLLREHGVTIVMAGDTHDLEYYAERAEGASQTIHHFVNGGGGAYLSFGTALAWPAQPATHEWAFYPTTAQVVSKIEATTPWWKWPAWWWTTRFKAWPFSPEWLAAAFDVNVAPFYQSFVEVLVEPTAGLVRFRPHGVHGRLRWADLQASPELTPAGVASEAFVEWVVEMPGTSR